MAKGAKGQRRAGRGARSPVTLRLGDLEEEVAARQGEDLPPGAVVKRDLARYYRVLRDSRTPILGPVEGLVLVYLLQDFEDAAYLYIWAEVEKRLGQFEMVRDQHPLAPVFKEVRRSELVSHLRARSPGQCMDLLDAVERFWRLQPGGLGGLLHEGFPAGWPVTDPVLDRMVAAGLVDELHAKSYRTMRQFGEQHGQSSGQLEAALLGSVGT